MLDTTIVFENVETDLGIPSDIVNHSEMADVEQRFLNGIIKTMEPRNLLEIGVSQGAGTVVLLNAIRDMLSRLLSVDTEQNYYRDTSLKTGYLAEQFIR